MTNFEKETEPLNELEKRAAYQIAETMRVFHIGRQNAVTADSIGMGMARTYPEMRITDCAGKTQPYLTGVRIRKIMNFIRRNHLVRFLIASGNGYYIAETSDEVAKYIKSLDERIEAINVMKHALICDLNTPRV